MIQQNLFYAIVGSKSYGADLDGVSDFDRKFVYAQHPNDILGFRYREHIEIDKDHIGYELSRFVSFLTNSNPNALELINSPVDCIENYHPAFRPIIENADKFLSKKAANSFLGFATRCLKKHVEDNNSNNKSLYHAVRLIDMAREIATEKKVIVRRPNAVHLKQIKQNGLQDLEGLNNEIKEVYKLFEESDLPQTVDMDFAHDLVIEVRNKIDWNI